jgi:tetratricopeptide (TPR) repeat protein
MIATSPTTPALRREQIELQVALITPLIHSKGYAAPETKTAIEQARLLIEEANARGEPPEDPLLLFSVLYSFWLANFVAGNGDATCELAHKFLALAEEQAAIVPLTLGHRIVGTTMLYTGDFIQGRAHLDQAIALYDPAARRPLAVRFSQDDRVSSLIRRSEVLWSLGYPQAALADVERALNEAREIGHFASLAFALWGRCWMWIDLRRLCGSKPARR